jgi:hypothetical protein
VCDSLKPEEIERSRKWALTFSANEERETMSTDLVITNAVASDGWADTAAEASERLLRGTLLKFADWNWSAGKEATPLDKGRQFIAIDSAAAWVKWVGGKPAEHRVRLPGKPLPDREELGDLDENFWELTSDGKRRDPWQNTRFVTLVCPHSAELFTFSTSSWGGRSAVVDLADAISRMRTVYPDAVPVVELQAAPMATQHGRKSKPVFKVVAWKSAAGKDPAERTLAPPTVQEVMEDEIPF